MFYSPEKNVPVEDASPNVNPQQKDKKTKKGKMTKGQKDKKKARWQKDKKTKIPEKNVPVEDGSPNVNLQHPQSDQKSTSRHYAVVLIKIIVFLLLISSDFVFCFLFATFGILGLHCLLIFRCPLINIQSFCQKQLLHIMGVLKTPHSDKNLWQS